MPLAAGVPPAQAQGAWAGAGSPQPVVGRPVASLGSSSETWRLRCGLYRRLLDPGPHRSPDLGVVSDPLSCQWRAVPAAATGLELPAPTRPRAAARPRSDGRLGALRRDADT